MKNYSTLPKTIRKHIKMHTSLDAALECSLREQIRLNGGKYSLRDIRTSMTSHGFGIAAIRTAVKTLVETGEATLVTEAFVNRYIKEAPTFVVLHDSDSVREHYKKVYALVDSFDEGNF